MFDDASRASNTPVVQPIAAHDRSATAGQEDDVKFSSVINTPARKTACCLMLLFALVYLPFAGRYALWDPWETHYGEVARQMAERGDVISLWWPGSPQDRPEVFHKPVFSFWLMAGTMRMLGLESGTPAPAEMVDSWRVEWACRLPFVLLSIACLFAVWEFVRRIAGWRAGLFSALILGTSTQWALITRQAMTDMAFVVPMTIAVCLAGLALLGPTDQIEEVLPRKSWSRVSWPHARSFYVFLLVFALPVGVELILFCLQLKLTWKISNFIVKMPGIVPMLPYIAGYFAALFVCSRAKTRKQIYLHMAFVFCGYATLDKGPAGLALPGIVIVLYLLTSKRYKEVLTGLEIPTGVLLFVVVAFPWYHAMLIRHGMAFWNEFIGDNYVHRMAGRHGDRGVFSYYLEILAYGMFPWSGLAVVAAFFSLRKGTDGEAVVKLRHFCAAWLLVEYTVMSLVVTKFHHYILPAVPPLAILTGLLLQGIFVHGKKIGIAIVLIAVPVTLLSGVDLASFQARIIWLFNYDYVNMPGTGRSWPSIAQYGDRYEYQGYLWVFAFAAAFATVFVLFSNRLRAVQVRTRLSPSNSRWTVAALVLGTVACLLMTCFGGPKLGPGGRAPEIAKLGWLEPVALALPAVALLIYVAGRRLRWRAAPVWVLVVVAVTWTMFVVDKMLVELSPHWGQKHVIASYYANRKGPEEPLIVWNLYWRGENLYTRNEIYRDPSRRTVFLGPTANNMGAYFKEHGGQRLYFLVERVRFEALRSQLPEKAKTTLRIVDDSNNKLYLAAADL